MARVSEWKEKERERGREREREREGEREREREGACLLTIRVTFVKPFVTKHLLYINGALRRVRPLPITP
jgi:hypothetical protein